MQSAIDLKQLVEAIGDAIVAADAGVRYERAHGKGVDELVVERLIPQRLRRGHFAFATNRLRRIAAGHGVNLGKGKSGEESASARSNDR